MRRCAIDAVRDPWSRRRRPLAPPSPRTRCTRTLAALRLLPGPDPADTPAKRKKSGKKADRWQPAAAWAGFRLLGLAAAAVLAVVGWRALEAGLLAHARAHHGGPVAGANVALADAPPWVADRPELREKIRAAVAEVVAADPFGGDGLRRAADRLAEEPWVAGVSQVRRTAAGVVVEADWRAPLALVRARDGYHVVDADGRRLEGPTDRFAAAVAQLPVVTGVSTPPPARAGRRWPGAEVAAGVALVKTLKDEPFAPQIAAYDVGQRDPRTGRLSLVLHTDAGSVVWGRPVDAEFSAAEVSVEEKVDRLHRLADAYRGRIDAGGRVVWIYGERMQYDERPPRGGAATAAGAGGPVGAAGAVGARAAYGRPR